MNCPKCDAKLNVIDSRAFSNNTTKRRLACEVCGERFTSVEKIMTKEEMNAPAATAEYSTYTITQPTIDLSVVFEQMAKHAIVKNSYTSALTGGVYENEEDALKDTIKELKRLCKEQF